jgi:hypothetical protein
VKDGRLEVTALREQMAAQSQDLRELKALLQKQMPRMPNGSQSPTTLTPGASAGTARYSESRCVAPGVSGVHSTP